MAQIVTDVVIAKAKVIHRKTVLTLWTSRQQYYWESRLSLGNFQKLLFENDWSKEKLCIIMAWDSVWLGNCVYFNQGRPPSSIFQNVFRTCGRWPGPQEDLAGRWLAGNPQPFPSPLSDGGWGRERMVGWPRATSLVCCGNRKQYWSADAPEGRGKNQEDTEP